MGCKLKNPMKLRRVSTGRIEDAKDGRQSGMVSSWSASINSACTCRAI